MAEPTSTKLEPTLTELKPCPFCGCESLTISVDGGIAPDFLSIDEKVKIATNKKYVTTCTVACDSCGASVQGYHAASENNNLINALAALDCFKKWNRRAGE